jgi:NADH-quinone oxidoreductase subunit N
MKYYLLGVFASARDALRHVAAVRRDGTHALTGIESYVASTAPSRSHARHHVHRRRFAFKVSAVPFHTGRPTRTRAHPRRSPPSFGGVEGGRLRAPCWRWCSSPSSAKDVWQPLFWVLSALTMTVGNLIALRQTNIVRCSPTRRWPRRLHARAAAVVGDNPQASEDALTPS